MPGDNVNKVKEQLQLFIQGLEGKTIVYQIHKVSKRQRIALYLCKWKWIVTANSILHETAHFALYHNA